MELNIDVWSSRNEISYVDPVEPFQYYAEVGFEEIYSSKISISITDEDTKELVAEVSLITFCEDTILNDHEDILDIADAISIDCFASINYLIQSKAYSQEIRDEELAWRSTHIAYISKVYIYPKYRKRGIGKYILQNLYDILLYSLNIYVRCFTIFIKPQRPTENGWENIIDENMSNLMVNVVKKVGYKQTFNSNHYILNAMK